MSNIMKRNPTPFYNVLVKQQAAWRRLLHCFVNSSKIRLNLIIRIFATISVVCNPQPGRLPALSRPHQRNVTYPNSVVEVFTYYADNSLRTLSNKRGTQILEAYNYSYDAAGNLTQKLDGREYTDYTYNVMIQLLTVQEPGGKTTTYAYD